MVLRQVTSNEKGTVKWGKNTKDAIFLGISLRKGLLRV